jgi:hypothetical protein
MLNGCDLDRFQVLKGYVAYANSLWTAISKPYLFRFIPAKNPLHNLTPNDAWDSAVKDIECGTVAECVTSFPSRRDSREICVVSLTLSQWLACRVSHGLNSVLPTFGYATSDGPPRR